MCTFGTRSELPKPVADENQPPTTKSASKVSSLLSSYLFSVKSSMIIMHTILLLDNKSVLESFNCRPKYHIQQCPFHCFKYSKTALPIW